MSFASVFLWWLGFLAGPFVLLLFITAYRFREGRRKVKPPFTHRFMRSPGESANRKVLELTEEFFLYVLYGSVSPPFIFSGIAVVRFSSKGTILGYMDYLVGLVISLLVMGYCGVRIVRLLRLRRNYRLGYEGEVATGQELNLLMLEGYHVFHDVPADRFNIDHVVVGPAGVFAVETKARSKALPKKPGQAGKVVYDGTALHFPDGRNEEFIRQAKRQAAWLAKWLRGAIGEPVPVHAALALPGWYVERKSPKGIPVLNPREFVRFVRSRAGNELSSAKVGRIVHQLEQKCRDVLPRSVAIHEELS